MQQIDYLEGREFPAELGRFLTPDGVLVRNPRQPTDVFVVEISTVKEIVFDTWYLQINYLERTFRDREGLLETFFGLKGERDPEVRRRHFEALPDFAETDALERRVLTEGYIRSTTRDELEAHMAEIVRRLPADVVFVNHINVPNTAGSLVASRNRLCGWIAEICTAKGYRHFDPSPHVAGYGVPEAMAEEGRDLNHYANPFKPIIGSILFDGVLSRVAASGEAETALATAEATPTKAAEAEPAPRPAARPALVHASMQAALNEAKRRIADGDLDEAESILHGLSAEDGRHAVVHTLLGTVAFHRGDTTAATAEFREAVEIDPAASEPRLMLVKSALRVGKLEEACAIAGDLVRRAPDDLRVLLVAAKAMMRAKQFAAATEIWQRVSIMRPELVLPLIEMARCEMKVRNYEAALAAANAALRRDPREAGALVIKSDALLKLKRMRELAEVSLELAAIEPKAAMAAVPALISSLHPEEAASIVATARETGEIDIDTVMRAALIRTLERRGKVATERGDTPAAAAAWKAILLIDPDSARAAAGLRRLFTPLVAAARARAAENDIPGAVAAYEAALVIQNDGARILRELSLIHEKAGDWFKASQSWARLARISEDGQPFKRKRGAPIRDRCACASPGPTSRSATAPGRWRSSTASQDQRRRRPRRPRHACG
ncbi:tetratricopeptide repeat protein [Methylobacterium sp. J-092]|uniref:tetratricopeptide repeat protein n=1 Tax=Methylobacterium sp. J-092 TaxID=2836667 RepID=UPI001FB9E460|nr:tetratricopeptide repeat protein [Methylobacterium sp. J-092]MCJ2007834.1 tetratricopeptide repeat protein [Methylobacterium sp. J-092]